MRVALPVPFVPPLPFPYPSTPPYFQICLPPKSLQIWLPWCSPVPSLQPPPPVAVDVAVAVVSALTVGCSPQRTHHDGMWLSGTMHAKSMAHDLKLPVNTSVSFPLLDQAGNASFCNCSCPLWLAAQNWHDISFLVFGKTLQRPLFYLGTSTSPPPLLQQGD